MINDGERRVVVASKHVGVVNWVFWCPGCRQPHIFFVWDNPGVRPHWHFNGNDRRPTFSPSLLNDDPSSGKRCHLFCTDGVLEFCDDCSHEYAGKRYVMAVEDAFAEWCKEENDK
jgi:hypothetical protein